MFVRMEPTSYVVALCHELIELWPGQIDVFFAAEALSQDWSCDLTSIPHVILPSSPKKFHPMLWRHVSEQSVGVVHAAGWGAPQPLTSLLAASWFGVPSVLDSDTWISGGGRLKSALKRVVLTSIFNRVSHFLPAGVRQASYLRQFGVPDCKITLGKMTVGIVEIQSFLRSERDSRDRFRKRFGIPQDATVALYVGRLAPEKGVRDLLKAWEMVLQLLPNAYLVVCGEGELRAEVEGSGLANLVCTGRLAGDDVWRAYSASDLFVAPSVREPWGLVINEAMASGLPILMTDAFGCIDTLARPGENVAVVPAARPRLFAEALAFLLQTPGERQRLRDAALAQISGWTIRDQANLVIETWRMLLGRAHV